MSLANWFDETNKRGRIVAEQSIPEWGSFTEQQQDELLARAFSYTPNGMLGHLIEGFWDEALLTLLEEAADEMFDDDDNSTTVDRKE